MKNKGPCPCGKSSDAFVTYPDGHGYCFRAGCQKPLHYLTKPLGSTEGKITDQPVSYQYLDWRGVPRQIWERYRAQVKVEGETPTRIGFPYSEDTTKARLLDKKEFYWTGKPKSGVFGKISFPIGTFDDIIITEGEIDAPSAYFMVGGSRLAAVSVQSATSAAKDLKADYDYINSAKRIFICFDNDEPGHKAEASATSLFDFHKLFKIDLGPYKDANEVLQAGKADNFRKAFHNAKKLTPDGVVSSYQDVLEILKSEKSKPVVSFPLKAGESKLEGFRLGTSVLLSGLEGIGKTEVLRLCESHILKETDFNVGIIHLEEGNDDTINFLLPYQTNQPMRRKDVNIPIEDRLQHYKNLTKRDNRVFIYSHFGSDNPDDFLGIIRYLVAVCDCKFIFLDHINFIVSQMDRSADERRTLDYICTRLAKLVEELNFCLVFICHENADGGTRGSMNISQTAHVRIRLSRDIENPSAIERVKTYLSIAKNRPTGLSGPIGFAFYDEDTGTLTDGVPLADELKEVLP